MDFHLSDGQQLLVNTAREFLRRHCPLEAVAESASSERGFSAELWKEISVLGWPGLLIPAEYGGSDGTIVDVALLVEEMGRACFPSPYVPSAVVATSLLAAALARAAEMVGCAQRILELCVEHAKGRRQFGRPLGSFQAVQHACADLLRDVETARGLLHSAAWRKQEGLSCATDVAMAKAYAGRTSQAVARKAHQLLGAISFCEEHPLHL